MKRTHRQGGGLGRLLRPGTLCGLILVAAVFSARPGPAATPKKNPKAKAALKSKAGRPLFRPFDPVRAKKGLHRSALVTIKGHQHVSEKDYDQLRDASIELLKRYDPATHYFVGTGRDPAPIIAFLQNLGGKDLATNFPASGGIFSSGSDTANWRQASQSELARYFRHLIPSHVWKSGRTIVLVDVSSSGKTPAGFAPEVKNWLKSEKSRSKVRMVAFAERGDTLRTGVKAIDTRRFKRVYGYMYGPYEGVVNEFDSHSMGVDKLRDLKPRPQYAKYGKAVLRRMARDRKLDKFLRTLKGTVGLPFEPWLPKLREVKQVSPVKKGALFSLEVEVAPPREAATDDSLQAVEAKTHAFDYLSQGDYDQLKAGTGQLFRVAPPERAFYVGLGNSSTPIVAMLDSLAKDLATYLPLDGLGRDATHLRKGEPVRKSHLKRYFRLLDQFLPRELLDGERQVVLFRHSSSGSGKSIEFAEHLVSEWMKENGVKRPAVVSAVFSQEAQPKGIHHLDTTKAPELEALGSAKYAAVAPYFHYRAGPKKKKERGDDKGRPLANEEIHTAFRTELLKRLGNNPTVPELRARLQQSIDQQKAALQAEVEAALEAE